MRNKFTFITYICSKDLDKLTRFVWELPYRIEVKGTELKDDKWYIIFNHSDEKMPRTTKLKNIDLDKI